MKRFCECGNEYNHKGSMCSSCRSNRRRFKLRDRIFEIAGNKCINCGFNNRDALVFHHRDPATKKFTISSNHCRRWQSLIEELEKCDLLCANCHSILHAEEGRKSPRFKKR